MTEKRKRGRPPGTIAKGRHIQFFANATLLRFLALQNQQSADLAAKHILTGLAKQAGIPMTATIPKDPTAPLPKTVSGSIPQPAAYTFKCERCRRVNFPACPDCRKANGVR